MNKSSFDIGMSGTMEAGAAFALRRNANEELARILGGIGALPDPIPVSERVESLCKTAMVEWPP